MTQQPEGRRLAAIMFMDMVGYSARMQRDEQEAIGAVRALWERVRPILAAHGGREVDLAGDGMLMEFAGALSAVRCAIDVHASLEEYNATRSPGTHVRVRAGVHLGDVEHRDGRIYGDGINIAARVIALAPPGATGMSPHVRDQLLNSLDEPIQSLGMRKLKNIKAPMELWCLPGPQCSASDLAAARRTADGGARRWFFGPAVLDERTLELTVGGAPVQLQKDSLDALLHLLLHAGEVVTREELTDAVWPGGGAPAGGIEDCVARLVAALRDDSIVKTVHGFGHRLAAPVKVETLGKEKTTHFAFHPGMKPPLRPMWSLVEQLGAGGQGEAWLAQHDKTRERRVFKFALDGSRLDSLKREITLCRVLKDTLGERPGFVRILDWNLEEPPYFIESEHVDGGNLAQWLEREGGAAPRATRVELMAQVAEAIAAAHSVGVLHKDLKPGNVLVETRSGAPRARLCDFGSGGVLDTDKLEQMGITRMGFTRTILDAQDSASATPFYLAPEVLAGQPFTVQSDVYALGVMTYQLVTGDLKRPLAPGWETEIDDELLRQDIADAAAGNVARRLPDAGTLAQNLRTLEQRRRKIHDDAAAREEARRAREEAEQARQKLRTLRRRRAWLVFGSVLGAVALLAAFFKWFDSFNEAEAMRVSASALADALPLRERIGQYEALTRNCYTDSECRMELKWSLARLYREAGKHEPELDALREAEYEAGKNLYLHEHIPTLRADEADALVSLGKFGEARAALEALPPPYAPFFFDEDEIAAANDLQAGQVAAIKAHLQQKLGDAAGARALMAQAVQKFQDFRGRNKWRKYRAIAELAVMDETAGPQAATGDAQTLK